MASTKRPRRGATGWRPHDPLSHFLVELAAGREVGVPALDSEVWEQLHRHGLVGLAATEGPSAIRSAVQPHLIRLRARQEVMLANTTRVLGSLAEAGVPVTILKGPHLDGEIYRREGQRTYTDIDLFVPPDYVDRALSTLLGDPCSEELPPKRPKAAKRELPFRDPSGLVFAFDLHWDPFGYRQLLGAADGAARWSWDRAEGPVAGRHGPVWRLPAEAMLAFLCAHALLDHRFRLILFRDLVEVARGFLRWEELVAFAGRWGLRWTTYLSLLVATRALGASVPDDVLAELRPRAWMIGLAETSFARADVARLDGHRPHPLNLLVVLLHDRLGGRVRLACRAPLAVPGWRRRTEALQRERGQGVST